MMRESSIDDYGDLHRLICIWIDQNKFEFDGHVSEFNFTELDRFLMAAFGIPIRNGPYGPSATYEAFNEAIFVKELEIDWLLGEHGPTLFKAYLIQKGMFPAKAVTGGKNMEQPIELRVLRMPAKEADEWLRELHEWIEKYGK